MTYTVTAGSATVTGSTLTVTGTGLVTVQASQSIDPNRRLRSSHAGVQELYSPMRTPIQHLGIGGTKFDGKARSTAQRRWNR